MNTDFLRGLIPLAWLSERPFDPPGYRLRLERAKEVAHAYAFELLHAGPRDEVYMVTGGHEPYLVFMDLSGSDCHYCTCPDGAVRRVVPVTGGKVGGSLCKHVIAACLHGEDKAHLLTLYTCFQNKRPFTFFQSCDRMP